MLPVPQATMIDVDPVLQIRDLPNFKGIWIGFFWRHDWNYIEIVFSGKI